MNHPADSVNHPFSLVAAIWLGIIGSFVLLILPVFVGTLISEKGFSEVEAGWVGSADLMGFALAAIAAFFVVRRANWKLIVLAGLSLIIVGDISSIFLSDFWLLFAVRLLLSGLGAGFVIAVPYTLLGDTDHPERNTGLYFSANVLGGTAGLFLLPLITESYGATGLFLTLALTASSAIPIALVWLPSKGTIEDYTGFQDAVSTSRPVVILLTGIALFNLGMGGVWAFVERIGTATGLEAAGLGIVLSSTYLVGMLGSTAAAFQAARWGFVGPYIGGIMLMCLALFSLSGSASFLVFAVTLSLMNISWNYCITYQFSGIFTYDDSGRVPVLIILVQALGLMLGPGIAGMLVSTNGFGPALLFGGASCVGSAVLFIMARIVSERTA